MQNSLLDDYKIPEWNVWFLTRIFFTLVQFSHLNKFDRNSIIL